MDRISTVIDKQPTSLWNFILRKYFVPFIKTTQEMIKIFDDSYTS